MTIKSSRLTTATTPFISEVGGTASYATVAQLPFTNNAVGDKAFIVSTGEVVIWDGSKWTITSTLSSSLALTQLSDPTYTLSTDGTSLVITLAATGTGTVNWAYNVVAGNEAAATIAQNGSEFTITPSTSRANNGVFKILFTAYDDDSVATVASQFVLNIPLKWFGSRGVIGSGYAAVELSIIDYITIPVPGNSTRAAGELSVSAYGMGSCSDGSRGIFAGGNAGLQNQIDYVTISTLANATNFGLLTVGRYRVSSCSNGNRGIFGLGYTDQTTIDYITISTPGNAVDFGDLSVTRYDGGACSDGTYGIFAGGYLNSAIDYVTIETIGNTVSFGTLSIAKYGIASCSDAVHGLFAGGETNSSTTVAEVEYITIATTGNATNFGSLTVNRTALSSCSDNNYGVFIGGVSGTGTIFNTVDYVVISTPGDSTDFGDLTASIYFNAACSGN